MEKVELYGMAFSVWGTSQPLYNTIKCNSSINEHRKPKFFTKLENFISYIRQLRITQQHNSYFSTWINNIKKRRRQKMNL